MNGKCLCGAVEFEIVGQLSNIYQCHCSQCRKATGSASNSAIIVPEEQLQWHSGREYIRSYSDPSGYRSDFCSKCGSPVPNPLKGRPEYWVPAGLLESGPHIEVAAHLHVDSKADWDRISGSGIQFQQMPDFEQLLKVLKPK
jgi:hypothetical protein